MPDAKACSHRLKRLWTKQSKAIGSNGVEKLRDDTEVYMQLTLGLKKAHCLLRMLAYRSGGYTDVNDAS